MAEKDITTETTRDRLTDLMDAHHLLESSVRDSLDAARWLSTALSEFPHNPRLGHGSILNAARFVLESGAKAVAAQKCVGLAISGDYGEDG